MCHHATTTAIAAALVLLAAAPARADCEAASVDNCLVGTWKRTGGGPGEWMREHMKMAQIKIDSSDAMITLKADGTLSTSKVDTSAEIATEDSEIVATGKMISQGSGRWSAAGGTLTMCMDASEGGGTVEFKMPGGKTMNMPMPKSKPTNATMTYTCAGDALSTVQAMPMDSEMTTTYTRVP
jgi:hypothetical protein